MTNTNSALDAAARLVGCFRDFADLVEKCSAGYVPTLQTELDAGGRRSAETMAYVNAARDVARALAIRGFRYFPRVFRA